MKLTSYVYVAPHVDHSDPWVIEKRKQIFDLWASGALTRDMVLCLCCSAREEAFDQARDFYTDNDDYYAN